MSISVVGEGLSLYCQDDEQKLIRKSQDLCSKDKFPALFYADKENYYKNMDHQFSFIENTSNVILVVNSVEEFYVYLRDLYLFSESVYEVWMFETELFIMNQIFDHLVQEFGCRKSFFEYKIRTKSL